MWHNIFYCIHTSLYIDIKGTSKKEMTSQTLLKKQH